MSEEEKKAIKYYESEIDLAKRLDEVIVNGRIEPLEKIINLTKKQQKEIEKKDKIIDLMAKKLEGLLVLTTVDSYSSEDDYLLLLKNKEEVKQYFLNKAKES